MNKINILSALCISMMFASCSSDEYVSGIRELQKLKLKVAIDAPKTRAATNLQSTQVAAGRQLYVFTFTGTGSSTQIQNKVTMTADGNGNLNGETEIFYDPETTVNVWAFAPRNSSSVLEMKENEDLIKRLTQIQDQSVDANYIGNDYIAGHLYGIKADGNSHVIQMKHLCSKLTVKVLPGTDGYTLSNSDISTIELTNVRIANIVTFSKLHADANTDPISISPNTDTGSSAFGTFIAGKNTISCSAILPPQTLAAGTNLVKVTLSDGVVWMFKLDSQLTLESGKAYELVLTPERPTVGGPIDGTQDLKVNIVNWETVTYEFDLDKLNN